MPAVARGGHGHVGQGDTLRGRHLGVDLHLPWRTARPPADAAQLAADLEQQVAETERAQRVDAMVDCEALGDAGQVELHAAGLQERGGGRIECQPLPVDVQVECGQRVG
ncbi:hypothetical protein FQZ97_1168940 [compost metagenome]